MDPRQWAGLLDDDGIDDDACQNEIDHLRRAVADSTRATAASTPRRPRRRRRRSRTGTPPGDDSDADILADPIADASADADADLAVEPEFHADLDERAANSAVDRAENEGDHEHEAAEAESLFLNPITREPLRDLSAHAVWTVSTAKPGNGVEQLRDGKLDSYWQSDGPQPHSISAQFTSKVKVSEVRLFLSFDQDESYTPSIISVRVGSCFHSLRVVRRNKELLRPQGWIRIAVGSAAAAEDDAEPPEDDLESDENDSDVMTAGELAEREQRRRVRIEHANRRKKADAVAATAEEKANAMSQRGSRRGIHVYGDGCSEPEEDIRLRIEEARAARQDTTYVRAHMVQVVIHCNHQNGRDSHVRQVQMLGPTQQVADGSSHFSSPAFQRYETIR
jgi:Anaphase-promoting complex, subunit 10 (APC10)